MRNCSNCNERHLDRDCPNRPPTEPLRAPATAAGAGTADPPKQRASCASRPATIAPRATAPELPATCHRDDTAATCPGTGEQKARPSANHSALRSRAHPRTSALRFGIEHTKIGWTSPHEAGNTDAPNSLWAPGAGYSRPALSARRASSKLSGPTYSMFAERNLAQPPHDTSATPSSFGNTLGGSLASLAMRLLCLLLSAAPPKESQQSPDTPPPTDATTPPLCDDTSAEAKPAQCPATPPSPIRCASSASTEAEPAQRPATPPSPIQCARSASTELTPSLELDTAKPNPLGDDTPASRDSPPPTPPTPPAPGDGPPAPPPSPPPSPPTSPMPVRPSSAPPSPPPSPPTPRHLCAIQSCDRPTYADERPGILAICCNRRHQLLHTALQCPPVCAIAECTRPVHIDEQAAIVHDYCGITQARLAATRGETTFLQDRPAAVAGAEVCAYAGRM